MKPWAWTMSETLIAKLRSGDAFSLNVWFVGQRLTDEPARLNLTCVGDGVLECVRLGEQTEERIYVPLSNVIAIEVED